MLGAWPMHLARSSSISSPPCIPINNIATPTATPTQFKLLRQITQLGKQELTMFKKVKVESLVLMILSDFCLGQLIMLLLRLM
jgi:hypothetical protein